MLKRNPSAGRRCQSGFVVLGGAPLVAGLLGGVVALSAAQPGPSPAQANAPGVEARVVQVAAPAAVDQAGTARTREAMISPAKEMRAAIPAVVSNNPYLTAFYAKQDGLFKGNPYLPAGR